MIKQKMGSYIIIVNKLKQQRFITKRYNIAFISFFSLLYQSIRPISLTSFLKEYYFFTFTNNCIYYIKTYIGMKKNNWLNCLIISYNLVKIYTKFENPIKKIQSNYGSKLQSKRI